MKGTSKSSMAASSAAGELAAEIFQRFDQGQSLREVVMVCRQPPELVRALYRQWGTPLGEAEPAAPDALAEKDDQDLVRWEEQMRAMTAAEEEWDRRERLAREARREQRLASRTSGNPG